MLHLPLHERRDEIRIKQKSGCSSGSKVEIREGYISGGDVGGKNAPYGVHARCMCKGGGIIVWNEYEKVQECKTLYN
jgi:hypothetical protein